MRPQPSCSHYHFLKESHLLRLILLDKQPTLETENLGLLLIQIEELPLKTLDTAGMASGTDDERSAISMVVGVGAEQAKKFNGFGDVC